MNTKELKIEAPEGFEIDKENSTFEKIVFKKKENELPTKWEDLKDLKGCKIITNSSFHGSNSFITDSMNKNVFPTLKEAEACLALSQLCQLRDAYNGEPLADWCDWSDGTTKYCICFHEDKINTFNYNCIRKVLAFKTEKLRDKFAENFRELIETAKPLL